MRLGVAETGSSKPRTTHSEGVPDAAAVKNLPANAGGVGLTLGKVSWRREWLSNPMDRGAWRATVQSHKRVRYNSAVKQQHT